ncbi:MAG: ABC transporter substrate-binding protein [Candidatus Limivicinus sp.]|jgi:NitT/TauT family transport system substrate-binding protein
MKKFMSFLLAAVMLLSLAACGSDNTAAPADPEVPAQAEAAEEAAAEAEEAPAEKADVKIAALKGPTAFGMLHLMELADKDEAPDNYEFTLAGSPDELVGSIVKGELDIAAVPVNLASVLYNKTEGAVQMLALNTLGVICCVENGDSIHSVKDLAGKTVYSLGKGSTPEFIINYLLTKNGLDPEKDVDVQYKSEPAEAAAMLAQGKGSVAVLPQPFVTALMVKNPDIRIALDFNEEWSNSGAEGSVTTGCLIVQKAFAEENPEVIDRFLAAYEESVNYTNGDDTRAEAAKLAEGYGILPAPVAEKAIPHCYIVCILGDEMKAETEPFLQVLFDADPASAGGKMPGEDFYFNAK